MKRDVTYNLKAKELRKLKEKELLEMLSDVDKLIARYRCASRGWGIQLPPTKTGRGTNWGLAKVLKGNKAKILTVLTEMRRFR